MVLLKDVLHSSAEKYGLSIKQSEGNAKEIVIFDDGNPIISSNDQVWESPDTEYEKLTISVDGNDVSFDLRMSADDIQDEIYDAVIKVAKEDGSNLGLVYEDLISNKDRVRCISKAQEIALKQSKSSPRNILNPIQDDIKSDLLDEIWSDICSSHRLNEEIEKVSMKTLPMFQMALEVANELSEYSMSATELAEVYESYAYESFEYVESKSIEDMLASSIFLNYSINARSEYLYDDLIDLSLGVSEIPQEVIKGYLDSLSISYEDWNAILKREGVEGKRILSQHNNSNKKPPVITAQDLFDLLSNSGEKGILVILMSSKEKDVISIDIEHSGIINNPIVAIVNPFDGTGSFVRSESKMDMPVGFIENCYFDSFGDEVKATSQSILGLKNKDIGSFSISNSKEVDVSRRKTLIGLLNKLFDSGKIKLDENNSLVVNTESYLPQFGFRGNKIDFDSSELMKSRQRINNNYV